jgi:hypothetical protein
MPKRYLRSLLVDVVDLDFFFFFGLKPLACVGAVCNTSIISGCGFSSEILLIFANQPEWRGLISHSFLADFVYESKLPPSYKFHRTFSSSFNSNQSRWSCSVCFFSPLTPYCYFLVGSTILIRISSVWFFTDIPMYDGLLLFSVILFGSQYSSLSDFHIHPLEYL